MVLTLVYPPAADNNFKKYYVCYRLQEKIRLVHNNWGAKFRNGEITEDEWHQFLDTWYEPRWKLIRDEILRIRQLAKNHNWNINLNDVFVDDTFIYPPVTDDNFKKYYFCYRIDKKLQDVYRNWEEKFRNSDITEVEWNEFLDTWYRPRRKLTREELLRLRQLAKDKNWNINLNNIFIEE